MVSRFILKSIIICIILGCGQAHSQSLKSNISRDTFHHTYLLNSDMLTYIYRSNKISDTAWLFARPYKKSRLSMDAYLDSFDYGAYIEAKIIGNQVTYRLFQRFPFRVLTKKIDNQIIVYLQSMSKYNYLEMIHNAVIRYNGQLIRFDSSFGGYIMPVDYLNAKQDKRYLSISYRDRDYIYSSFYYPEQKLRKPRKQKNMNSNAYGYLVTDKPVYRQGDSFRLKAVFLDNETGDYITKPVQLTINDVSSGKIYVNQKLESTNLGSYHFDWEIPDSMKLDRQYQAHISFYDRGVYIFKLIHFDVQSYLLEKSELSFSPLKSSFRAGEKIDLKAVTTDANGFPLSNVHLQYIVSLQNISKINSDTLRLTARERDSFIVVDTILPYDKIHLFQYSYDQFPQANMSIKFSGSITDAEYERRDFNFNIAYNPTKSEFSFRQSEDTIFVNQYEMTKSVSKRYILKTFNQFNQLEDSFAIQTPYSFKLSHRIIRAEIWDSLRRIENANIFYNQLSISHIQGEKGVRETKISFRYPFEQPVYYRVKKKNKLVASGMSRSLEFKTADTSLDEYTILLSHNLGGNITENCYLFSFFPLDKKVNIVCDLPESAFPGQTIPIHFQVTDWYGRPVPNFNLMSYALNTQLPVMPTPMIHVPEQYKLETKNENLRGTYSNLNFSHISLENNYYIAPPHIDRFDLYKNQFYQTMFPRSGFDIIETSKQFPKPEVNVVLTYKGSLSAPKYFEVDNKMMHITKYNLLERYAHLVDSGKHSLTIRTYDLAIHIPIIQFSNYKKYTIAINLDSVYAGNYSKNIIVTDSLSLTTPSPIEREKIESSFLIFHGFGVDSVMTIVNSESTAKEFKFHYNNFHQLWVDGNNFNVIGPISYTSAILKNKNTVHYLATGRYIHYYDWNKKSFESRDIPKNAVIDLSFNDQILSYDYLSYLVEPDNAVPVEFKPIPTQIYHSSENRSSFDLREYSYTEGRSQPYFTIHTFQNSKTIKGIWIINPKDKMNSQFFNSFYNGTNIISYNTETPIDLYVFTSDEKLKIYRNLIISPQTTFYLYADSVSGDTIDVTKLSMPIQIFNKLTEIPKLPFYYSPEESHQLKIEPSSYLNSQNTANFSGTITDRELTTVDEAYVILEQNGVYKHGAYTNEKGEFEFLSIPAATYDIKVYHPDYLLKFFYRIPLGGRYQQQTTIELKEKEGFRPIFESITNSYRLSFFNPDQPKSKLKVNVYDRETRTPILNSKIKLNYTQDSFIYNYPQKKELIYDHIFSDYELSIIKEGYQSVVFQIWNNSDDNVCELDVFLSKLKTKTQTSETFSLNLNGTSQTNKITNTSIVSEPNQYKILLNGNSTLRGKVTDEKGEVVPFAMITIVRDAAGTITSNVGAKTNKNGIYIINNLPAGRYNLRCKSLNKEVEVETDIEIIYGKTTTIDFVLQPISNRKKYAVAIKTKSKDRSRILNSERPKQNMISESEIKESAVRDVNALASSTGGIVQEDIGMALSAGGGRADGVTYIIDGVKVQGAPTNQWKSEEPNMDGEDDELEKATGGIPAKYGEADKDAIQMKPKFDSILSLGLGNQIRKDFNDVGYWLPSLITDSKGSVSASIRLPDNITQWQSYTLGVGRGYAYGQIAQSLKSYKPMQTVTYTPKFLHKGDQITLKARFTNFLSDPQPVDLSFQINGDKMQTKSITLDKFFNDSFDLVTGQQDTIAFQAGLDYQGKYSDAELIKIPVFGNHIKFYQNQNGYLDLDSTYYFYFKENTKGSVIINNSIYENILTYIEDLKNYQYGCVEQTSSKLKALVYQQDIFEKLLIKKNNNKQINKMLKKLGDLQNDNGSYGWWRGGYDDYYMTTYALEANLIALRGGMSRQSEKAIDYLFEKITKSMNPSLLYAAYVLAKYDKISPSKIPLANISEPNLNTTERIYLYKIKQMKGIDVPTADWYGLILDLDNSKHHPYHDNFFHDRRANIFNAYSVFRGTKVEKEFSTKFRAQLTNGSLSNNLNTFAKASLIEALLIDAESYGAPINAELIINDKQKVKSYPYRMKIDSLASLKIAHKGAPVWVNTSEEEWIENPNIHDSIFRIETNFSQRNQVVSELQRGVQTKLNIDITAFKTKDFVMIEIPLPAGVILKNKSQNYSTTDYTEYYDDRILIYKSKIGIGQTSFSFDIQPIYAGTFAMPPAQISLMYYPYVYGNNLKSKVVIK